MSFLVSPSMFPSGSVSAMHTWSYILVVLFTTCLWVYCLREQRFSMLIWAMFLPATFAFVYTVHVAEISLVSFLDNMFWGHFAVPSNWLSELSWSIALSIILPVGLVALCASADLLIGWGQFNKEVVLHDHNKNILRGFLRAAGEEVFFSFPLLSFNESSTFVDWMALLFVTPFVDSVFTTSCSAYCGNCLGTLSCMIVSTYFVLVSNLQNSSPTGSNSPFDVEQIKSPEIVAHCGRSVFIDCHYYRTAQLVSH